MNTLMNDETLLLSPQLRSPGQVGRVRPSYSVNLNELESFRRETECEYILSLHKN